MIEVSEKIWRGVGKDSVELHHAYCLCGERTELFRELFEFLEEVFTLERHGNPDFSLSQFDTLTIEESRRIKEIQGKKAFGKRKVLVVAFNTATREAQNALLKVLEEPSPDTFFFLIVPSVDILLPTLRSRVFLVDASSVNSSESFAYAKEFLSVSLPKRLIIAKKIAEAIGDGKKEKQFAIDFIGGIEHLCAEGELRKSASPEVFSDIAKCRSYINDRSASVKMLLEHLSLVLPRT